jgi:hypothetical protein
VRGAGQDDRTHGSDPDRSALCHSPDLWVASSILTEM